MQEDDLFSYDTTLTNNLNEIKNSESFLDSNRSILNFEKEQENSQSLKDSFLESIIKTTNDDQKDDFFDESFNLSMCSKDEEEQNPPEIKDYHNLQILEIEKNQIPLFLKNENFENDSDIIQTSDLKKKKNIQFFLDLRKFVLEKNFSQFFKNKKELENEAEFLKKYDKKKTDLFFQIINRIRLKYISKGKCQNCKTNLKNCKICKENLINKNKKKKGKKERKQKKLPNLEKCKNCQECLLDFSNQDHLIKATNATRDGFQIIYTEIKEKEFQNLEKKLKENLKKSELLNEMNIKSVKIFNFLKNYFNFKEDDFFLNLNIGEYELFKNLLKNLKEFLNNTFGKQIEKMIEFVLEKKYSKILTILKKWLFEGKNLEEIISKKKKNSKEDHKRGINNFFKELKELFIFSLNKKIIKDKISEKSNFITTEFVQKSSNIKKRKKSFFYTIRYLDKFFALSKYTLFTRFKDDFTKHAQLFYLCNTQNYYLDFKKEILVLEKDLSEKNFEIFLENEYSENDFVKKILWFFKLNKIRQFMKEVEKEKEY